MTTSSIIAIIICVLSIGAWLTLIIYGTTSRHELPEWMTKPWRKKKKK